MECFSAVNRRRPSRETPFGPGVKDGCFCRLFVWLRMNFGKSQKIFEKWSEIFGKSSSYQVKHSKKNSISTRTIVLSSIYFVRPKYSCMYSHCEMLSCSQTWYKAWVVASAHNCLQYMLLQPSAWQLDFMVFGHYNDSCHLLGKHQIIWQKDFIVKWILLYGQLMAGVRTISCFSQFCQLIFDFV